MWKPRERWLELGTLSTQTGEYALWVADKSALRREGGQLAFSVSIEG